jgi:GxxExxY protein
VTSRSSSYASLPPETERIATRVVDAAFQVHSRLGPGLLESAYEICVAYELERQNLRVERQVTLPIQYGELRLDAGYRLDLLVERQVIVELKAVEKLIPLHDAQVLTYMKLSGYRLGLLINFSVPLIKDGIRRFVL